MAQKAQKHQPTMEVVPIGDLIDDHANANKGTERGHRLLENSVRKLGAARSLVVDKDGRLVAGNKTRQALADAGFENALVIETDGTMPVVVKRKDWDLTEKGGAAREYAFYDNRVGQLDLEWDADQIRADLDGGLDLSDLFSEKELEKIIGPDAPPSFPAVDESVPTEHRCPKCGYEWSGKAG